jgi:hypothetical protein
VTERESQNRPCDKHPLPLRNFIHLHTWGIEFNTLEPEDAMQLEALRPDEKTLPFGDGAEIVKFAHFGLGHT